MDLLVYTKIYSTLKFSIYISFKTIKIDFVYMLCIAYFIFSSSIFHRYLKIYNPASYSIVEKENVNIFVEETRYLRRIKILRPIIKDIANSFAWQIYFDFLWFWSSKIWNFSIRLPKGKNKYLFSKNQLCSTISNHKISFIL